MKQWFLVDYITGIFVYLFNLLSNIYFFFNFNIKKRLRRNDSLERNSERCFIIGNGPSLNDTDIYRIKNSDTMTVNFFFKGINTAAFHPTFHIAVDDAFYSDESAIEYLRKKVNEYPDTKFIVKYRAYDLFHSFPNAFYLYMKLFQWKWYVRCNIKKNMTSAINVSIAAVQVAISMGYKEIYLIGVDYSDFTLRKSTHFYAEDALRDQAVVSNRKCPRGEGLRWVSLAFYGHYALARYAEKHKISIINLTPDSFLDAYLARDYNEVIEKLNDVKE